MGNLLERVKRVSELDVEGALNALGGSDVLYERILRMSIKTLPQHMSRLRNAETSAALSAEAHALKGVLGNIGAFGLGGQALALERQATAELRDRLCEELDNLYGHISELIAEFGEKPAGKDLELKLEAIAEAAGSFELPLAQRILESVRFYTYGEEWDERLQRLNDMLEYYDLDGAISWIAEWRRGEFGEL